MNGEIREMVISDYEPVIKLWSATEAMAIREADSKASIQRYLKQNPGLSFVAIENNQIIGAVLVGTDGRRGYIQHLAVSKEYRGQGIGKVLVNRAVLALERIGVSKTHLFVFSDNINAQKFYQNLGWIPRDEIRMFSFITSTNPNV